MRRPGRGLALALVPALAACSTASLPSHPDEIVFPPPIAFEPPTPDALVSVLSTGTLLYVVEDHSLPLVTITVLFRGGQYLDPAGMEGLGRLCTAAWPTSGAGRLGPQELDALLAGMAAELSAELAPTSGAITLDVPARDLEDGLTALADLLAEPRFESTRLDLARNAMLLALRARNDDPGEVAEREWRRLVYGPSHWRSRQPTAASLGRVGPADCQQLVHTVMQLGNTVVAVSGDVTRTRAEALVEQLLQRFPDAPEPLPPIPDDTVQSSPGVYLVDRPGLEHAHLRIGHLGVARGHPDETALMVLDHVLGGGGFTSRITRRVRTAEGLAYTAASVLQLPPGYPGTVHVDVQAVPANVARVGRMIIDTLDELRTTVIGDDELQTAREAMIGDLPERFATPHRTAVRLADDALFARPPSHWTELESTIRNLSPADLLDAARTHLHTDQLIVLVVGDRAEIEAGHPDSAARLRDLGPVRFLPERDPLTLEVVETPSGSRRTR
jgi:zinc protease